MKAHVDISAHLSHLEKIKLLSENLHTIISNNSLITDASSCCSKAEFEAIVNQYNDAVIFFNTYVKDNIKSHIDMTLFNVQDYCSNGYAKRILLEIICQCEKIIGALKKSEVPIPLGDIETLDSLRKELEEISDKTKDINYCRNLEESVKEYENGHYLASTLISSRVIDFLLSQVSGNTTEEKISSLIKDGLLEKGRRDVKESIIKSSKLARNFVSHDIGIFPSPSESLSLLSDSITLLKLLKK